MNKRQRKKFRKKIYEDVIIDVVEEISLDSSWRKRLFEGRFDKEYEISYLNLNEIPEYIRNVISYKKLKFIVKKVEYCSEQFDKGMIIFEFQSIEFPDIIRFSGNNPNVI